MNTHAPSLVPPDAIDRVSRFTLQDGHTIRRALNVGQVRQRDQEDTLSAEQISQNDLVKLRQLLQGNLTARALLFSRAVLLLEGKTELGALPVWCPDLVRQDIALYAVDGNGSFVPPLRFIQHFAIPWAIIGDGEVLWDLQEGKKSRNPLNHISDLLAVSNQPLPSIPGNPGSNLQDFAQWQQALEGHGIFTLASSAREGFEKAVRTEVQRDLWSEAETKFGKNNKNKVAQGRFIAENSLCPKKVAELMRNVMCHWSEQGVDIRIPDKDYLI